MSNLTRAHHELFRRSPDERFASLRELLEHCQQERVFSSDCWYLPQGLDPQAADDRVTVRLGDDGAFLMNDWSFSQLCRLSGVTKGTLNRLSPETASHGHPPGRDGTLPKKTAHPAHDAHLRSAVRTNLQ